MATGTVYCDIDQGGSGFCKFSNGMLICWGTGSYTPDSLTGTPTGSVYYHVYSPNISFPVEFYYSPTVIISKAGGRAASVSWASWNTKKITEIDLIGGVQTITGTGEAQLAWCAFGWWRA